MVLDKDGVRGNRTGSGAVDAKNQAHIIVARKL